jgi:hypothetical protein
MSYIGTEPKDIRSFGRTKFDYTATQGQTAFTGADDDGKVLAFTVGQIEVYVNGILMDDSDFTTTGTGTVTLASAANLNDVINIISFESNIPDNDYVPASGGTFTGAVTHSGAVTLSGNVSGATTFTDEVTFQKNINVGNNTNLLTNGDFTTDTSNWTATTATLSINSSRLQIIPDASVNGFANQQVDNLVVGRSYIASVDIIQDAAPFGRLYIGTSANGNQTVTSSNLGVGTHSFTFTATATTHHFALVVGGGTQQTTIFDNARLVEASRIEFPAASGTAPMIRQGTTVNDLAIATNNINRFNIDSSGRVTMPSQPAIQAGSSVVQNFANSSTNYQMVFGVTNFSRGGLTRNGNVFTVPVGGYYVVNYAISADIQNNIRAFGVRLQKNGSGSGAHDYHGAYRHSTGSLYTHHIFSGTFLADCAANDTLSINGIVYDTAVSMNFGIQAYIYLLG